MPSPSPCQYHRRGRLLRWPCAALVIALCGLLGSAYVRAGEPPARSHYEFAEASRDGIGKFYMGREISQVMGHLAAGWLERPAREREERTDLLLAALPVKPGHVVADLGAGSGYFTLPMARLTGEQGRVLAVDIQPEMLSIIRQRMEAASITNIELIQATETDPALPAGVVDVVLLVDAYHEFSHPREVMEQVVRSLTDNGRVVLVEYRGEDPTVPIKALHKMTVAQAERELGAAGLALEQVRDDLPMQHIMIFRRASEPAQGRPFSSASRTAK